MRNIGEISKIKCVHFHSIIFLDIYGEIYILSLRVLKRGKTVNHKKKICKLKVNYYKRELLDDLS